MLNRAWLAGGIPRTACVAAYEPICAVSLANSYINRANPGTLDAYAGTAPTWAESTGWTFNGSTQYLLADITAAAGWSAIVKYSGATNSVSDKVIFGSQGAAPQPKFFIESSKSNQVIYAGQGFAAVSPGLLSGVLCISGRDGYRDGVSDGTCSDISGTYRAKIAIGALQDSSVVLNWGGNIQALYIYNVPLTPTQVRAVTDAMNMLPMRPKESIQRAQFKGIELPPVSSYSFSRDLDTRNTEAWLAGGIPRTACVAAYEPICAVSLADSYINRANPGTYNAAPGVAPTWAAETGWTFDGSTQYLTTGYRAVAYGSLVVKISNGRTTGTAYNGPVGAVGTGALRHYILSQYWYGTQGRQYGISNGGPNSYPYLAGAVSSGVLALAGIHGYLDGTISISGTSADGSSGSGTSSVYIGAISSGAGIDSSSYFGGNIQAVYIYNVPLTPTQVKAVTDAMNSLPMRPSKFQRQLGGQDSKRFPRSINKSPFVRS